MTCKLLLNSKTSKVITARKLASSSKGSKSGMTMADALHARSPFIMTTETKRIQSVSGAQSRTIRTGSVVISVTTCFLYVFTWE